MSSDDLRQYKIVIEEGGYKNIPVWVWATKGDIEGMRDHPKYFHVEGSLVTVVCDDENRANLMIHDYNTVTGSSVPLPFLYRDGKYILNRFGEFN